MRTELDSINLGRKSRKVLLIQQASKQAGRKDYSIATGRVECTQSHVADVLHAYNGIVRGRGFIATISMSLAEHAPHSGIRVGASRCIAKVYLEWVVELVLDARSRPPSQ